MSCYKEFAQIYDELIRPDIDYKKWSAIILNICRDLGVKNESYLDLACGTGNITEEIGKAFKQTWAVDMSPEMLTEAENKLRKSGVRARFVCQDICCLNLNKKFDLITCCLDSTNYILDSEEILSYFASVHDHLNDDGLFLFDINSYYKLTNILGNNMYKYEDEKVVYIWENSLEDDIVDMYLNFFVKEGEFYKRFDEEHSERAYKEADIERMLQDAGFTIEKKLNNYEEKPVIETTERIVYIVKKK